MSRGMMGRLSLITNHYPTSLLLLYHHVFECCELVFWYRDEQGLCLDLHHESDDVITFWRIEIKTREWECLGFIYRENGLVDGSPVCKPSSIGSTSGYDDDP